MANAKSKKIELGIKGDPSSFKAIGLGNAIKSKGSKEYYSAAPKKVEMEQRVEPGYLISRQNHPVTLSYGGEALILPPRGRVLIANAKKLGGLALNVVFVPAPHLKN